MKHRLPVIAACLSFLILGALITAGLLSPGTASDRSERLFAGAPGAANRTDEQEASGSGRKAAENKTSGESQKEESPAEKEPDVKDESPDSPEPEEDPGLENEAQAGEEAAPAADDRPVLPEFKDLLEINPYVSGWLRIDGTPIDEPVVYTPKSQNYFIHRALDGSDAERGSLFIAVLWRDGYNNTLIYGHNMRDGSGFGTLKDYAKSSYGQSHSLLHFDTLYEEREYQLFAVFYSEIEEEELETEEEREERDREIEEESSNNREEEASAPDRPPTLKELDLYEDWGDVDVYRAEKDEDNGRFRYYYYTDLSDQADFEYYVSNVKDRALYDTGVDVSWGDELLTLSTCSYHTKNGRLIVVAKRIK